MAAVSDNYSNLTREAEFQSKKSKRTYDPWDSRRDISTGYNYSNDSVTGLKKTGVMTITPNPKGLNSRPHLKQTTLSFSKHDSGAVQLSSTIDSTTSEKLSLQSSHSTSNKYPQSAVHQVYGLSFDSTITTLTIGECLSVKMGMNKSALLPSPYRDSQKNLSYELFGKATDVQYNPPERPPGCVIVTLVDDDYSEGFKVIAWKMNLEPLVIQKNSFYRCIGTLSLDLYQKTMKSVFVEELSEEEVEFLRGAALGKWQTEE